MKLDKTFPLGQFKIDSFNSPFRRGRNIERGGIMLLVRKDIPTKLLAIEKSPRENIMLN